MMRSCFILFSLSTVSAWVSAPLFRSRAGLNAAVTLDGEVIRGDISPLGSYVLVKTKDTLTATEGGILLPDQVTINFLKINTLIYASLRTVNMDKKLNPSHYNIGITYVTHLFSIIQAKERPTEGVVVAAGPGKLHPHTGVRIQNPVQLGDSVLYGKFDGAPIEYKDDQCQVIRDDNIMVSYQGLSMTLENCQPIRDFVLIQLEEQALETKSGIVVAAQVVKEDVICEGRILKVGEGRMASNGSLTKVPFKVGDFVKFKDYGGNDIVIEGKPFSLVRMTDILATQKEQE